MLQLLRKFFWGRNTVLSQFLLDNEYQINLHFIRAPSSSVWWAKKEEFYLSPSLLHCGQIFEYLVEIGHIWLKIFEKSPYSGWHSLRYIRLLLTSPSACMFSLEMGARTCEEQSFNMHCKCSLLPGSNVHGTFWNTEWSVFWDVSCLS